MSALPTLHALAERVLFGETLADKLWSPERVQDTDPGLALPAAPSAPGRPPTLRFRAGRARFPKTLTRDEDRGLALHFFANHELLAMELMALALLRFPDAPRAFRAGVAATLRDEQRHLRMYLARMEALGVPFGALPVSDFFWSALSGMPDPIAYAANMGLVLEQANLDFAAHYGRAFLAAGDRETASVLAEVLRDEVRHVAHGVRWLRRLAPPGDALWDAWVRAILPPLTPARAKGSALELAPRQQAGLPEDFVERLRVFSHSRGRAPILWWFDPTVEAQAGGERGPLKGPTQRLVEDLETLPLALAAADDVVAVRRAPPLSWLAALSLAGLTLPEFIQAPLEGALPAGHPLRERTLGGLSPWGWGPRPRAFAAPLVAGLPPSAPGRVAATAAMDEGSGLYGKPFAARLRADAAVCSTSAAVDAALARLTGPARVKAAFGTAGRGQVRLASVSGGAAERIGASTRAWLARVLARQGAVVVEPDYAKVADVSALFEVDALGVRPRGVTRFVTDARGTWRATCLGAPTAGLSPALARFWAGGGSSEDGVVARMTAAGQAAGEALRAAGYRGPAGVDGLVARGEEGEHLVPILEVNPRWTMGHVALRLARRVAPGSVGRLWLAGAADVRAAEQSTLAGLAEALAGRLPLRLRGQPTQIAQGVVPLAPPARAQVALPLLVVAEEAALADALAAQGAGWLVEPAG